MKYEEIGFNELSVGDKFRRDFFNKGTGRRRKDIICIKTGNLSYIEQRSQIEYKFRIECVPVRSFDKLLTPSLPDAGEEV